MLKKCNNPLNLALYREKKKEEKTLQPIPVYRQSCEAVCYNWFTSLAKVEVKGAIDNVVMMKIRWRRRRRRKRTAGRERGGGGGGGGGGEGRKKEEIDLHFQDR